MGWIVYRKKWNPTQVNTSYKIIKRSMDKIQVDVSVRKSNDTFESFEINDISKHLIKIWCVHLKFYELVHLLIKFKKLVYELVCSLKKFN